MFLLIYVVKTLKTPYFVNLGCFYTIGKSIENMLEL